MHVGAEEAYFQGIWNEDGTEATMSPRQGESLTSGTYDDVLFHYTVVRDGITETLDIPIAHMVVAAVTVRMPSYRTMMYMPLGLLFVNVRRPSCTVSVKFSV